MFLIAFLWLHITPVCDHSVVYATSFLLRTYAMINSIVNIFFIFY